MIGDASAKVIDRQVGRVSPLVAIAVAEHDAHRAADEPTLSDEVLALCDAMGVRRPDADETRWLLAEPQFHRRAPIAVVDTLRAHRNGLTPEQVEASERATNAHRDPSVPRRKR